MNIVADTNVIVSAVLWSGPPHRLLPAAEAGLITLYTSPVLLDELAGVLARPKFASRMRKLQITANELVAGYAQLAHLVLPQPIPQIISQDPSDDVVLATARTATAAYIVSGDPHLLNLKQYEGMQIVSPRYFVEHVLKLPPHS